MAEPATEATTDVVATTGTTPAAGTSANPFKALGLLLKAVNDSVEGIKLVGQAPRWVRVVRIREFCRPEAPQDAPIAGVISNAAGLLLTAIAYIQKFTLTAEDLLVQGDSAKALFEVSADMLKEVAKPEFFNSITEVVGSPPQDQTPLAPLGSVIDKVSGIVDKVPEPEDLLVIGAQIYRMLVIEQLASDGGPPTKDTVSHIDIGKTGKMRLIQWGLAKPFAPLELSGKDATHPPQWLGIRRLWDDAAANMPVVSTGIWGDKNPETVFNCRFADPNDVYKDINEVKSILSDLGYYTPAATPGTPFDNDLATRLRQFQHINMLKITGALDNATINQLLNLQYDPDLSKGGLRRARRYDANKLTGFDASKNPS
jgi:Putative peptidoglycan binding domain